MVDDASSGPGDHVPVVSVREIRPADLPVLFVQQADPAANRMAVFTAQDPTDRAAFDARWVGILADPTIVVRAIVVDGVVAGSILLWRDPDLEGPEVSYWIGREFWGRGIATAGLRRFLGIVTVRPLYGRAASTNVGSIRVLEKCGFRPLRVQHEAPTPSGALVDEVVMRLDARLR